MTQEIKTEKFDGLLVKQPNWAIDTGLRDEGRTISFGFDNGISREYSPLPEGQWKLIGNPFELSEEECQNIIKSQPDIYSFHSDVEYYDYEAHRFNDHLSAKGSLISLIKSLQVYKENPYSKFECPNQWCENGYIDQGYNEKWRCYDCQCNEDLQDEAEERTGNWILLEKLNN